jgi:hypothetical protein
MALVVQNLDVLVDASTERHAHLLRPGKHLRVFDSYLIVEMVAIDE